MRRSIGIAGLIVVAVMLAMVTNATAQEAVDMTGQLEFENGTACGLGIVVCVENLNETIAGEPWCEWSFEDQAYIFWDYLVTGQASSDEKYIKTFAYTPQEMQEEQPIAKYTTPDDKWYGEKTAKLADVRNGSVGTHYIFDIILYEQELPPETFTKDLVAGWNLVSLPLTPDDNSTSAVLGSITGNYDAVKSYNAATHQFEDADTMDPEIGYFIHITDAAGTTWTYEGDADEEMSVGLSQGLNCVGWTNTSASLPGALDSIAGNYRYAARWNATSQSYEVFVPNAPSEFNDFDTMERGEGYFIAAKGSCTLTYP